MKLKMLNVTLLFACLFVFTYDITIAISSDSQTFDILKIAGKTDKEVEKVLGISEKEKSKYGQKRIYFDGNIEIIFIKGKADWITINDFGSVPYNKKSLAFLGLPIIEPTIENKNVIRWGSVPHIREISFFPSGPKVAYVCIKVTTP